MSPEVMALSFLAMVKTSQGYGDAARTYVAKACVLADSINHDATSAFAHYYGTAVSGLEGDAGAALEHITELVRVAHAAHFPHWIALGDYQSAMLEAVRGDAREALPKILDAKSRVVNMGVGLLEPTYAVSAVPMNIAMGRMDEAATELAAAESAVERGGLYYFTSLIYRARGLLAQAQNAESAAQHFELASERARGLGQTYFQVRALCDLLQLEKSKGDAASTRKRLADVLATCDTAMLQAPDCRRAARLISAD